MNLSSLAYEIIDECKCGPEEFFVLVSSVYPGTDLELQNFLETLSNLLNEGLIIAYLSGVDEPHTVTLDDLQEYVSKRTKAGESLDECFSVCSEYRFFTSDKGLDHLKDEDKPINLHTS